jgi:hypothetical protein
VFRRNLDPLFQQSTTGTAVSPTEPGAVVAHGEPPAGVQKEPTWPPVVTITRPESFDLANAIRKRSSARLFHEAPDRHGR